MKSVLLHQDGDLRTYLLVMDDGDEAVSEVTAFAKANNVNAAALTAIGACRAVTLGYFDPAISDYRNQTFTEQLEIAAFIGGIAMDDGEPVLHAHVVLGRADFSTIAGHIVDVNVFPTMEIVLTEHPAYLRKRVDHNTGLTLISADHSTDAG